VRVCAVVLVSALALVLAAAAPSALRHSTVAKGLAARGEPPRAFLALDRSETRAFSARLRPEHRATVAGVDFRRYAVIAAFVTMPTPCHVYRVERLAREGRTLRVTFLLRAKDGPCILPITHAYHVVKVRRDVLGARPPARVVMRVVRG
jgi:hypothetical protein